MRRQSMQAVPTPLVVFTPKSLLRSKHSRSPVSDLMSGTFEELLGDVNPPPAAEVERIVFCSGKVAFDLMAERDKRGAKVAIARVEQLYPWPFAAVARQLEIFQNAKEIFWVQEEPENMGPWNSIKGRLYEAHGETHDIHRVSRHESGSPATGSATVHAQELQLLLDEALG
jgi:2-oxoglutarate dehydrogenase E1 component